MAIRDHGAADPVRRNYFEPEVPPKHLSGPMRGERMPAKYALALMNNDKLNDCCRAVSNLTVNYYQSPTALPGKPDIMIAQCQCGRRHWRFAVGGDPLE